MSALDGAGQPGSTAAELARMRAVYGERRHELTPAGRYSLFHPGQLYMVQQRQRALLALLRREGFAPLAGKRILEIGCGSGGVLHELLAYGASPALLHGVELLDWRLVQARALLPGLPLINADAQRLPYADASFDLVLQFTVFTSVLQPRLKQALAAELRRVLRPGGLLVWYDYWLNPRNRQTRGIRLSEVRSLFPGCHCSAQRITLAPPLARRLAPRSWLACYLLEQLGLFNTHYLAGIRPV